MVKERPIQMSGPMVRAILSGTKTQTRRVVKPQPHGNNLAGEETEERVYPWPFSPGGWQMSHIDGGGTYLLQDIKCPYGQPGDRLWVRESWCPMVDPVTHCVEQREDGTYPILYRATSADEVLCYDDDGATAYNRDGSARSPWRSPRFMPRWASRLTLELLSIRVHRLWDMTERDAIAEGVVPGQFGVGHIPAAMAEPHLYQYAILWDHLNARRGHPWDGNPWVWALEFHVAG